MVLRVFLIILSLTIWRSWDRLTNPTLWAEDGWIFLSHAYVKGISSIWEPYAGYFHTLPRILAVAASWLPLEETAGFLTFISIVVFAAVCASFSRNDFENMFPDESARAWIAIGFSFMPGLPEALGNLTNLHWFLALYVALLAFRNLDAKLGWVRSIAVFLAAGSCGECIVFVPLYVMRLHMRRRRGPDDEKAALSDWWVLGCLGLFALLNVGARATGPAHVLPPVSQLWSSAWYLWVNHYLLGPWLGWHGTTTLVRYVAFLYWILALVLTWRARARAVDDPRPARRLGMILFACNVGWIFLISIVRPGIIDFFRAMAPVGELRDMRYGIATSALGFLWFVAWFAWDRQGFDVRKARAFALIHVLVWLPSFHVARYKGIEPWRDALLRVQPEPPQGCEGTVQVAIAPVGWVAPIPRAKFPRCR